MADACERHECHLGIPVNALLRIFLRFYTFEKGDKKKVRKKKL